MWTCCERCGGHTNVFLLILPPGQAAPWFRALVSRTRVSQLPPCPPSTKAASLASCKGKPLPRHPLGQGQIREPVSAEVLPSAEGKGLFVPFSWDLWSVFLPPTSSRGVLASLSPMHILSRVQFPLPLFLSHSACLLSLSPSLPIPWSLSAPGPLSANSSPHHLPSLCFANLV